MIAVTMCQGYWFSYGVGTGRSGNRSELTDGLSIIVHLGAYTPLVQGNPEPFSRTADFLYHNWRT
jgi:hypothetical protein